MKKKLFYVPGLISLIGLPALLFLFPVKDPVFHNSIKLNLPQDDVKEPATDGFQRFDKAYLRRSLAGKKVEEVQLGEYYGYNKDLDRYFLNRELTFIGDEMERLQFTHDTSTVLKVSFGSENTYGQFVYLLNLTILDHFRRYVLYDDDLYLFPNEPTQLSQGISVDELPLNIGLAGGKTGSSVTKWDIFLWDTEYRLRQFQFEIKDNAIFCSGFFMLIVLPLAIHLWVRKRNKQIRSV